MNEAALKCKCGCGLDVTQETKDKLRRIEGRLGMELIYTSGARCAAHNSKVSATGDDGPHTYQVAADIACKGAMARDVIGAAIAEGMTGIGISQKGPHEKRFVHIDLMEDRPGHPRPWVWTY